MCNKVKETEKSGLIRIQMQERILNNLHVWSELGMLPEENFYKIDTVVMRRCKNLNIDELQALINENGLLISMICQ